MLISFDIRFDNNFSEPLKLVKDAEQLNLIDGLKSYPSAEHPDSIDGSKSPFNLYTQIQAHFALELHFNRIFSLFHNFLWSDVKVNLTFL